MAALSKNAEAMTAHESPGTTKLCDRTDDQITLGEVDKIGISSRDKLKSISPKPSGPAILRGFWVICFWGCT
jgi:hypothetical protein